MGAQHRRADSDMSDWPLWQGVPRMVPPPFGPPPKVRVAAPRTAIDASTGQSGTWTLPPVSAASTATPPVAARPTPDRDARRSVLPAGLAAVVLALAVVAGYQLLWNRPSAPAAQTITPIYDAAANLAAQPVLHYSGSQGTTSWDMYVTDSGEQIGTVTLNGAKIGTLTVGEVTYLHVPQNLLIQLPSGVTATSLTGRWITGDAALTGLLPTSLGTPSELATRLERALKQVRGFPTASASATSVNGVPALAVDTAEGELYVSASAPYRVLSIVVDQPRGGGRTQVDLEPMTTADQKQAWQQIIDETRQLGSAVNLGVSFEFNQLAKVSCSETECVVSENVGTSVVVGGDVGGGSGGDVGSGSGVTAVMSATVALDEHTVGSCTDTSSVPADGSTQFMSCVAQVTAGTGLLGQEPVAEAEVVAQAVSQSKIDQLVDQESAESSTRTVR